MNLTEMWTLTVTPWQVTDQVHFRLVRFTHNKHGRQIPSVIGEWDGPRHLFDRELEKATDQLNRQLDAWLARVEAHRSQQLGHDA